jgi:rRNA maturation protein Rpf1
MLVSTSRGASHRTRAFAREFGSRVGALVVNRGQKTVDSLAEIARKRGMPRIVIITDLQGNPASMQFIRVREASWSWLAETILLGRAKLAAEFGRRASRSESVSAKDSIGLCDLVGVEPEESDIELVADRKTITFFKNGKEVGPRVLVKSVARLG